jgi:hypothetical protein
VASIPTGRAADDQITRAKIIKLFDDTRKRLVETGTRNRLVHVNRSNTRGNVINIVNERSNDVYAVLVGSKTMRFLPIGSNLDQSDHEIHIAEERYTDGHLETKLDPDPLQKKLLNIAREAKTVEDDSGVNILYLAMGFLTWFEDKASGLPREAPLVLLPVELVRNARTSTYDIRTRDEEVLTNLPLQQRLRDDFGIALPEIEISEEWQPSDYFAQIIELTAKFPKWKVDPNGIQLGFYSFSKLLMYRDLAIEAWPDSALATHPLARGLLYEGFAGEKDLFGADDRLDDVLPPEKLFHVVDADASQAKVIEEVRTGRNLVVQGPPGTGKSQTITNIIASAARDGKTVLFLAEKMAALSVVNDRLRKVGLRDVCLELHSRTANKKTVLAELARTLHAGTAIPAMPPAPAALKLARDRLNRLDQALHRPIEATGETPYSVLGRQSRLIGEGHPPPTMTGERLAGMPRETEARLLAAIGRFGAIQSAIGRGTRHPFAGTRNLDLQPVDLVRLDATLRKSIQSARMLASALADAIATLALEIQATLQSTPPLLHFLEQLGSLPAGSSATAATFLSAPDQRRLLDALQAGADWKEARDRADALFVEAAFDTPISQLRGPLSAGTQSLFTRFSRRYRGASRELAQFTREPLPKNAAKRVELLDILLAVASKKNRWATDGDYCARIAGDAWRGERTDFASLALISDWCQRIDAISIRYSRDRMLDLAKQPEAVAAMHRTLRDAESAARAALTDICSVLDLDMAVLGASDLETLDLAAAADRFDAMARSIDRYAAWVELSSLRHTLVEGGARDLADRMQTGEYDGARAAIELRYARAERIWKRAFGQDDTLRNIAAEKRHELVTEFSKLERQRLKDNVTDILAGHLSQLPQGALGEMKVIRGEIGKKTKHLPIRKLVEHAGTAIQRIKPVLLMSPVSVAQFLPPGALSFDLLVIDEASQVRPEDALGAIARARQIVVVGDKKQLPPSSFFNRVIADEQDDGEGDDEHQGPDLLDGAATLGSMESILTLCEARGLSSRMLKWHYRSRDPSLIEVSNHEFYEGGLILPPSPLQKDPAYGLCFTRVDGVYDKGGKRDNRIEGEAIVARVAEHARTHPQVSLGIVTFSFAQRNVITELLEFARRGDGMLDAFLREGQSEDVFVKNIENVQGDERDVILISVGYGPVVPGGRLTSMSFGPVNGEGGERRLNVIFTRARVRCEVFASFDPGDMDVSRTSSQGPRILKRFLDFAKTGRLDEKSPTGLDADSAFEEDVAAIIRTYGFLADPQVGSAGFRIDLGIRHPDKPGTYILAVECDGATYHSALWARERDRLRQDVLEQLGWNFHRIWSTDWFYNRRAEIERLRAALQAAREAAALGVRITGANHAKAALSVDMPPNSAPTVLPEPVVRQMPAYRRASFPVKTDQEPHEVAIAILASLAARIVAAEGPIHVEEIARRIAACFGKERVGSRILAVTQSALLQAKSADRELTSDGDFWFTRGQAAAPAVRDRSAETGATLKASNISMLEIGAAVAIARDDNAGGCDEDLIRTTARLMGFKRVGSDLYARIGSGL